jgi:hypothetical protein
MGGDGVGGNLSVQNRLNPAGVAFTLEPRENVFD